MHSLSDWLDGLSLSRANFSIYKKNTDFFLFLKMLVLNHYEYHTMYFDHIPPPLPTFPRSTSPFCTHPNSIPVQYVLPVHPLVWDYPAGRGEPAHSHTPKENQFSLS